MYQIHRDGHGMMANVTWGSQLQKKQGGGYGGTTQTD